MFGFLVAVLLVTLGASPVAFAGEEGATAEPARYVPAHFGSAKRALHNLLEYPKSAKTSDGVRAVIFCQIIVNEKGRVPVHKCSNIRSVTDQEYQPEVVAKLRKARFSPALVSGKPVTVGMNLQVVFRCAEGRCAPIALPNLGQHAQALGNAYVSPQEIIEDYNWYERVLLSSLCADGKMIAEDCVSEEMLKFTVKVDVDDQGRPGQVWIVNGHTPIEGFVDAVRSELANSRFIPAYRDGTLMPLSVVQGALYEDRGAIQKKLPRPFCEDNTETGSRLSRQVCYTPLEYAWKRRQEVLAARDFYSGYSTIFKGGQ